MRVEVNLNDGDLALLAGYNRSTTMGIKKPGDLQRELLSDMENTEEKRMVTVPEVENSTGEAGDVTEVGKNDASVRVRADFLSMLSELASPNTDNAEDNESSEGNEEDAVEGEESGGVEGEENDGVEGIEVDEDDNDGGILPDDEEGEDDGILPDDDEEGLQGGVLLDGDGVDWQGVTFSEDVASEDDPGITLEDSEELPEDEDDYEDNGYDELLEDEDGFEEVSGDEDESDYEELPEDEDEEGSGELPEDEDVYEELPEDEVAEAEAPESAKENIEPSSPRSAPVVAEKPVSSTPRSRKVKQSASQPAGYSTPPVSLYDFIFNNGGSMLIEDVKKYYPIDEVKKALNLGKIYRFGNKVGV